MEKLKVVVKPNFNAVDAVIFEAQITLNTIETQHKILEYVS